MNTYLKFFTASTLTFLFVFLPVASLAFGVPNQPGQGAINIAAFLNTILTVVWWVFIAIVVVFFVIIATLFLSSHGNPEKIAQARTALVWGIGGVLVGILAFSILNIVGFAFGF